MAGGREVQQGATIVFPGSSVFNIVNIARISAPVPVIEATHLLTTIQRQKLSGRLRDAQVQTILCQNDPTEPQPLQGDPTATGTITITGPVPTGLSTGQIWAGSGFVVDVRSPEFDATTEDLQTLEIDVIYDGITPYTITPAAP